MFFMTLLLLSLGLLAIGVAGITIKIWAKKDGKFSGTCASQNSILNDSEATCGFCGKPREDFDKCSK